MTALNLPPVGVTAPEPRPDPAPRRTSAATLLADHAALTAGLLLVVISLPRIEIGSIGELGLISVLPVTYWVGLAGVWLGFAMALGREPVSSRTALAHVVGLVVALTIAPTVIYEHPRYPTAWMHVGFIDYIATTGTVDPGFDARFNWPGAFSLGAYLTGLLGFDTARSLLRWTPMAVNLIAIGPLWLLASSSTTSSRRRWSIVWLTLTVSWVGQDYLAPQSFAFIIYLTVLGLLLNRPRTENRSRERWNLIGRLDRRLPSWIRLDRSGGGGPTAEGFAAPSWRSTYALVILLASSLVISHQLTPFVLAGALLVLVLNGRLETFWPVTLVLILAALWMFFGASTYLEGHLSELLDQIGDIGGGVTGGVTDRFSPGAQRRIVLFSRMGLTAAVVLAGVAGFARGWFRRRADWALLGLAAFPLGLLAASSYGGEVVLRIALFATPFFVMLAVNNFVPARMGRPFASVVAVLVVGAVLSPAFMLARYGNEAFEQIRDEDIALWEDFTRDAPKDAMVVVPNFAGPWRFTELADVYYRVYADEVGGPPSVAAMNAMVDERPQSYVLIGVAARDYERIANGLDESWAAELTDGLIQSGYDVVSRRGTGVLLRRSA